jgi:maltose-binding protein MalE
MKKVIFIFLILISFLCLAVVSCAYKEESSTSSSSTDTTADGYMKNGNMLMVWGTGTTDGNGVSKTVNFPVSFSETPSVTANTIYSRSSGSSSEDVLRINAVTKSTTSIYISASRNFHYIAVGKWQ